MTTKQDEKAKDLPTARIVDFDKGLDPFKDTATEMVKIDRLIDREIIVYDAKYTEMTQDGELVAGCGFLYQLPDEEGYFRTLSWSKVVTEQLLAIDSKQWPLLGKLTEHGAGKGKYLHFE